MSAALSLPGFGPPLHLVTSVGRTPRYYQTEAVASAWCNLAQYRSTLFVMATGTGKTFTAAELIKRWLAHERGPVLWLNERDNLVQQVRGELADLLQQEVYIEQADVHAPSYARVVVGSLQSVCQPHRLARYPRDRFSLIIPDEAHHSVSKSYRSIFDHFEGAKIAGLTATPDRLDEKAMGIVYESQSADYQMGAGVADGYLVAPDIMRARRIDVSKIRTRGEFSDDQLGDVMGDDVLNGIVSDVLEKAPDMRGVLFFPRVDIAKVAAQLFNQRVPGCAQAVDGSMEREHKRAILRGHRRGDYLYACNVGVIEEGHDDAGIRWAGMCRPTKSRSKYTQWAGRTTRPLCNVDQHDTPAERRAEIAASSKPRALILDFVGNSGKHELVSIVDALAGRHDSDKVRKRAKELLDADDRGDVEGALEKARRMEAREVEAEAARVSRVKAAQFQWRKVNPFEAMGLEPQSDVATDLNRASQKQRWQLANLHIDTPSTLTATDAARLIKAGKARERAGLAGLDQVKLLSKHGIPAGQLYRETARKLMDAIAAHRGWTPPADVIERIIANGRNP